jgi:hypothetical protein
MQTTARSANREALLRTLVGAGTRLFFDEQGKPAVANDHIPVTPSASQVDDGGEPQMSTELATG